MNEVKAVYPSAGDRIEPSEEVTTAKPRQGSRGVDVVPDGTTDVKPLSDAVRGVAVTDVRGNGPPGTAVDHDISESERAVGDPPLLKITSEPVNAELACLTGGPARIRRDRRSAFPRLITRTEIVRMQLRARTDRRLASIKPL